MNVMKAIDDKYKLEIKLDEYNTPCILYYNSMDSTRKHKKDPLTAFTTKFLNHI